MKTSWWLNHPFEKCARQIGSFPQVGGKITHISNHQLEKEVEQQPICRIWRRKFIGEVSSCRVFILDEKSQESHIHQDNPIPCHIHMIQYV